MEATLFLLGTTWCSCSVDIFYSCAAVIKEHKTRAFILLLFAEIQNTVFFGETRAFHAIKA